MQPIARFPSTEESMAIFAERMRLPDSESVTVSEKDLENPDLAWSLIKELAPKWLERKKTGICTPDYPIRKKDYWNEYSNNCNPTSFIQLDQFLESTSGHGKTAIDIGCGPGDITSKLLEKGWTVIAVDPCFNALEILANNNQARMDQLTLVCKSLTKFSPEHPVDLVVCKDVFNHLNPAKFQAVFEKIHQHFLKKEGLLFGTLFSSDPASSKIVTINRLRDIGAWLLPNRRLIMPLLEGTGYKVERTSNSLHAELEGGPRLVFQFSAQKI